MWVPYKLAHGTHTHANGSTQQRYRARDEPENTADATQTGFPVLPHALVAASTAYLCSKLQHIHDYAGNRKRYVKKADVKTNENRSRDLIVGKR